MKIVNGISIEKYTKQPEGWSMMLGTVICTANKPDDVHYFVACSTKETKQRILREKRTV